MPSSHGNRKKRQNRACPETILWPDWNYQTYRVLSILLFLLPLFIAFFFPHDQRRLRMPDPWGYEVATQKFSQGDWTLTNEQVTQARSNVRLRGGSLDQYVPVNEEQWVFRQSPGYPLMLAPFYRLGIPRVANLLLALGAFFIITQWHENLGSRGNYRSYHPRPCGSPYFVDQTGHSGLAFFTIGSHIAYWSYLAHVNLRTQCTSTLQQTAPVICGKMYQSVIYS